ncbi:hypothetical protein PFISCL1PPCAC_1418, partial [Pristionchus fissidentatus]
LFSSSWGSPSVSQSAQLFVTDAAREQRSSEQYRNDPIYDFDNCLRICLGQYSRQTCNHMCWRRQQEPGKREVEKEENAAF